MITVMPSKERPLLIQRSILTPEIGTRASELRRPMDSVRASAHSEARGDRD